MEETLEAVKDKGQMDVIAELAVPLPGMVISEMLGVPTEDQPQFKKWSYDIALAVAGSNVAGSPAERYIVGQQSFFELSDYFRGIVAIRQYPTGVQAYSLVSSRWQFVPPGVRRLLPDSSEFLGQRRGADSHDA